MRKAQVVGGVVVNVIAVDPSSIPNWCSDWPDATDDAEIGGTYAGGVFTRPPYTAPPPPSREKQEAARRAAYVVEADPIFFMSQRGEATLADWEAKVAEIKARFPYPQ